MAPRNEKLAHLKSAMRNASKQSLSGMLSSQENQLLRKGTLPDFTFDEIRQRHVWSTYYFTSGFAGSPINAGGTLSPSNQYQLFSAVQGQNGQGLPQGFQLNSIDVSDNFALRIPDDQNFSVWEIGITFEPLPTEIINAAPIGTMRAGELHPHDVDLLCENIILDVKYVSSEVIYGPAREFTASGGVAMTGPTLLDYSAQILNAPGPPVEIQGGQASPPERHASVQHNAGNQWPSPKLRRRLDVPLFLRNQQTFSVILLVPRQVGLRTVAQGGTGGFRARVDFFCAESFRNRS